MVISNNKLFNRLYHDVVTWGVDGDLHLKWIRITKISVSLETGLQQVEKLPTPRVFDDDVVDEGVDDVKIGKEFKSLTGSSLLCEMFSCQDLLKTRMVNEERLN